MNNKNFKNSKFYNLFCCLVNIADLALNIMCIDVFYRSTHSVFACILMMLFLFIVEIVVLLDICEVDFRYLILNDTKKLMDKIDELYISNIFPVLGSIRMIAMMICMYFL